MFNSISLNGMIQSQELASRQRFRQGCERIFKNRMDHLIRLYLSIPKIKEKSGSLGGTIFAPCLVATEDDSVCSSSL